MNKIYNHQLLNFNYSIKNFYIVKKYTYLTNLNKYTV